MELSTQDTFSKVIKDCIKKMIANSAPVVIDIPLKDIFNKEALVGAPDIMHTGFLNVTFDFISAEEKAEFDNVAEEKQKAE